MPVYEYEHHYDDCQLCDFRFAVFQPLSEDPLDYCPSCGLPVRRVVSQVAIVKGARFSAAEAAKKGFTTWKKSGEGEWEKLDGPGVDALIASESDKQALAEEKVKQVDLDSSE